MKPTKDESYIFLYDSDAVSQYSELRTASNVSDSVQLCAAVPSLDSWLFSDDKAMRTFARTERTKLIADRMPFPEQIPQPSMLRNAIVKGRNLDKLVSLFDLDRAEARSPSLKYFLNAVRKVLDIELRELQPFAASFNRQLFANLVSEVYPADRIIFRTLEGDEFTAKQMLEHVREGDQVGTQYFGDILRIARDMLIHQSNASDYEEDDNDD